MAQNFFQTLRIPLLRGRGFDARDTQDAPPVVVINKTMADTLFRRRRADGGERAAHRPANDRHDRGSGGRRAAVQPGRAGAAAALHRVRAKPAHLRHARGAHAGGADGARPTASARRWSVDKDQPVWEVRSLESLLEGRSPRAGRIGLLSCFSCWRCCFGAGPVRRETHAVQQRSREFGVRLALGAGRELILRLVLGRGLRLAALGVLLGSGLAFGTTRLLRTLLFGVTPADPLSFAAPRRSCRWSRSQRAAAGLAGNPRRSDGGAGSE